jgi:MFS family permease
MAFAVKGVFLYYVVWIFFIGIAVRFAATAACQINISKWFFNKRGLAMAIFYTSGGLGGYIFTYLFANLIENHSWRSVWVVMMLCGVLTVILALVILKESPEDVGQQIDNGKTAETSHKKFSLSRFVPKFAAINKTSDTWTLTEAKKNKVFYVLIYFQFVVSFYMVSIGNLGIGYLNELALGPGVAAAAIATYSLTNIFGRLLVGVISDHVDSKYILFISSVLMGIGLLFMMFAKNAAMALVFSWIAGIGFGMFIVTPSNALVNYFGSKHYSDIISSFGFISGILCGFNSLIMGALCDLTGSSFIVWCISLGFVAISVILSLAIKIPRKEHL